MTETKHLSRRDILKGATAVAAVALVNKSGVVGALADGMTYSSEERAARQAQRNAEQREEEQTREAEDRQAIKDALRHNQAIKIKQFQAESGMHVAVYQAMTGWNADVPLAVDDRAMNKSMNFMIRSMGEVNGANGSHVNPQQIEALQQKAQAGGLSNIELTVIASATTGYHGPDGVLGGGGGMFNSHPFSGEDTRKTLLPLIAFSPDIYRPGIEIMTPEPTEGIFPEADTAALPKITPTPSQYMTAFFAHEFAHVLHDAVGTYDMEDLAYADAEHNAGEYAHKVFVNPLSWYHMAAVVGQVDGEPAIPPSIIVPELYQ